MLTPKSGKNHIFSYVEKNIYLNPPNGNILKFRILNVLIQTVLTTLKEWVAIFVELGHVNPVDCLIFDPCTRRGLDLPSTH